MSTDRRAQLISFGQALVVFAVGVAIALAAYRIYQADADRSAERYLDLTGQSLGEEIHGELTEIHRHLAGVAALDPGYPLEPSTVRMFDDLEVVARAEVNEHPHRLQILWSRDADLPRELPVPDRWAHELEADLALADGLYLRAPRSLAPGNSLAIVEPIGVAPSITSFLVGIIDIDAIIANAAERTVPRDLRWAASITPGAQALEMSGHLLHREYLQLDDMTITLEVWPTDKSPLREPSSTAVLVLRLGGLISIGAAGLFWSVSRKNQLARELEHSRRSTTDKDRFLLAVSHEMRTPLTAVNGFLQILREGENLTDRERAEMLEIAAVEASNLSEIVHDLMIAARSDLGRFTVHPKAIDLVAEVEAALRSLPATMRPEPIWLNPGTHVQAFADPLRVRQVLRNLLSNAHTYRKERVWIEVSNGGRPSVTIVDDGPGIPEEIALRVFDRYVWKSDDSAAPGKLGIGLAVANILAEAMGGELRYERNEGTSRFILTLPPVEGALHEETKARVLVGQDR